MYMQAFFPNTGEHSSNCRCLMQGEKETGISIIELVKEMDAGDMLHVEKMSIPENMIFQELEDALLKMNSILLPSQSHHRL